jgi:hypothetical protein
MGAEQQRRSAAEFTLQVKAFHDLTLERCGVLLRAVSSKVGQAVVVGNEYGPGTPVDTGNARGHWYASLGDTDPGPRNPDANMAADAGLAVAHMAAVTAGAKLGDVINYVNDAPYIEALNNGHSDQAPAGMTDAVVASWDQLVEVEAARLGIK